MVVHLVELVEQEGRVALRHADARVADEDPRATLESIRESLGAAA